VNKKMVGVIAAVVMAIVGTGVLVLFVQGAEDRALEGEELVTVLTADATIPAGTPAEQLDGLVSEERIPTKIAPEGVVSDLVSLAGLVTSVDLAAGETLLANRFVDPESFTARRGASVEVPEGLLEVTIAMSQEQFIGGIPVPGNTVALVALGDRTDFINPTADPLAAIQQDPAQQTTESELKVAKIIIQQALVTNVQGNPLPVQAAGTTNDPAQRVAPAEGSLLVTLAMEGPDVERLIYVRGAQSLNANLHMALHSGDALVPSTGISVENVINPEAPVG